MPRKMLASSPGKGKLSHSERRQNRVSGFLAFLGRQDAGLAIDGFGSAALRKQPFALDGSSWSDVGASLRTHGNAPIERPIQTSGRVSAKDGSARKRFAQRLVGPGGLEPPTKRL